MEIKNGDVLIAAITSCTNTSNPGVLLAAGLLAKKAVELGLTVKPHVKTSLAPGSRVVTEYLTQGRAAALPREARLQRRRLRLHHLHRQRRPAGAADRRSDRQERPGLRRGAVRQPQLRSAHPSEHPRQLPRLAAAGGGVRARRLDARVDLKTEPLGKAKNGEDVFIGHIWPSADEVQRADEARDGRDDVPQALRATSPTPTRCGRRCRRRPARSTAGRSRPTSPSRRSSRISDEAGQRSATSSAPRCSASSATR